MIHGHLTGILNGSIGVNVRIVNHIPIHLMIVIDLNNHIQLSQSVLGLLLVRRIDCLGR